MLSAEVREALAEPVIQVLATARRHARITVVGEPTQVAVAVIADTASPFSRPSSSAQVELSQHQQGGLLWAQTRWTAP
jgi:hypothetical protein